MNYRLYCISSDTSWLFVTSVALIAFSLVTNYTRILIRKWYLTPANNFYSLTITVALGYTKHIELSVLLIAVVAILNRDCQDSSS